MTNKAQCPPRVLGHWGAFAIVAGSMLGIGIFLSPPMVAQHVGSLFAFFGVWFFGGLTALGGAVAYSELGTMFPRSGGDYIFQREAFGPSVAFSCSWVLLAAVFAGSIAAVATGLATFQLPLLFSADLSRPLLGLPLGFSIRWTQILAVGLVLLLTLVNHLGAKCSGWLQIVVSLFPLAALLLMALFVIANPGIQPPAVTHADPAPAFSFDGLVAAYLLVYFAYSGWNGVVYVAGEVRNPSRTLPRSLVTGTVVITGLYLLLCVGFIKVLGLPGLRQAGEAGSACAHVLSGSRAQMFMTVCVALALLATLNGSILGSSRVAHAMACGGALWAPLARLHPRRCTPTRALWMQALWASVLVFTGSFEQILSLVSVAMVLSGTITVLALFLLRRRCPDAPRPYSAFGYPYLPALYLITNSVIIVYMLIRVVMAEQTAYPLIGIAIMALSYLVHRLRGPRFAR